MCVIKFSRKITSSNLCKSEKENYNYNQKKGKGKDCLEGSLDRVLFAAELDFQKILVLRLPQNITNVNTECAKKLKQLYSLCDQFLVALIYPHFTILILIL